jgi:hypothetical protein
MATFSISGSVGISNVGVGLRLVQTSVSPDVTTYGYALSDGTFTFSGLAAGTYRLFADTRDITSGAFKGYVYLSPVDVLIVNANVSGVNLTPSSPSANNYPS